MVLQKLFVSVFRRLVSTLFAAVDDSDATVPVVTHLKEFNEAIGATAAADASSHSSSMMAFISFRFQPGSASTISPNNLDLVRRI